MHSGMSSTEVASKAGFPPQIKYIIGNEGCERFSFYGMRSILTIFMVQHLLLEEAHAESVYHIFIAACYFTALFGGVLADRLLGRYKTILYLSLVYCVGHGVLAVWESQWGLYTGLFLIAVGSGGIKPCVSALVGDQFTAKNQHLVQKVYNLFYWIINFGSFFATLLIPVLLDRLGASVAFGLPGVLMGVATLIFWMGRRTYTCVPPTRSPEHGFVQVVQSAMAKKSEKPAGGHWLDAAKAEHGEEAVEGAKAVFRISTLFLAVSVFWALFDQHGSTWVLQAKEMNLTFMGIELSASQIAAWNPLMVMSLIPILSLGIYPMMEQIGLPLTPLRRMTLGMFVASFAFILVGLIQAELDGGNQLNVMWQFFPYLVITIAEVLISVTGLEFAYTQAPKSMKSTIMSFWLFTVFIGNVLTAVVTKMNVFEGAMKFYFFAILMAIAAVVFLVMAMRYKVVDFYLDDASDKA